MRYIIIYDIADDNLRNAIAKKLEDYGLIRIQFSSFIGNLPRFRLSSLHAEIKSMLKDNRIEGRKSVIIYPLCNSCFSKGIIIGEMFDEQGDDVIVV